MGTDDYEDEVVGRRVLHDEGMTSDYSNLQRVLDNVGTGLTPVIYPCSAVQVPYQGIVLDP